MGHRQRAPSSPLYLAEGAPFGTLNLRTEPWGTLSIDGTDTGLLTPVVDLRLRPGRHAVRVTDHGSGRMDGAIVEIVEGRATSLSLSLRALTDEQRSALLAAEAKALPKPAPPPADQAPAPSPAAPWDDVDEVVPDGIGPVPIEPGLDE
jgi:hypothetical protein